MKTFSISPIALTQSLIENRSLIYQMSKREVVGRYKGSIMGLMWSFFNPLLMLSVYTLVFGVIFKSRWGENVSTTEFAGILFAGLSVYLMFAETISQSPSLILGNVNYVKKVVFPLEILPWISMGSSLFHLMISLFVLIAFYALTQGGVAWTIIFFPVVLLPLLLFTIGLSWFLASLGTYVRDVGQIIGVFITALLFLSAIFYPPTMFPEAYQIFFYLNPLAFIIDQSRNVLLWGKMPDWHLLAAYYAVSFVVAWLGFAWFQKTRRGFADVL